MRKIIDSIMAWFYEPVDPITVKIFRILTGITALASLIIFAPYLKEFFSNEGYVTSQIAKTITSAGGGGNSTSLFFFNDDLWFVVVVYILTVLGCISYIAGFYPQLAAFITWLGYLSFYNRFPSIGYGGSEVLFILLFFSIFIRNNSGWAIRLIQINLAIIYVFAGVTKLQGPSWRNGTELLGVINSQYGVFKYYWLAEYPSLVALFSYISTAIEIGSVYLLWFESTRKIALLGIFLLNINIWLTINVTFFPFAMIAAASAFIKKEDIVLLRSLYGTFKKLLIDILKSKIARQTCGLLLLICIVYKLFQYFDLQRYYNYDCPSGYVFIQGSTKHGTGNFCVMQFEAKRQGDRAVSTAYLAPWTYLNLFEAREACKTNGPGYSLISDSQWMTIADNITALPINNIGSIEQIRFPEGNSTGVGMSIGAKKIDTPKVSGCNLYQPLTHKDNEFRSGACELRGEPTSLGCRGYCGSSGSFLSWNVDAIQASLNRSQLRTLVTQTGEVLWDLSGNVWEWTDERPLFEPKTGGGTNFYDDSEGLTGELPIPKSSGNTTVFHEYPDITNWKSLDRVKPAQDNWTSENGIGMIYLDPGESWGATTTEYKSLKAFMRGGAWGNPKESGIYSLNLSHAPTNRERYIGFRCTYNINN